MKGSWAKVDLLPATSTTSIDGDPVDAPEQPSTHKQLGIRTQVHVELSDLIRDGILFVQNVFLQGGRVQNGLAMDEWPKKTSRAIVFF